MMKGWKKRIFLEDAPPEGREARMPRRHEREELETTRREQEQDRRRSERGILLTVIAALVVAVVLLTQHIILTHRSAVEAERAYQRGLEEAQAPVETILVDERVKVSLSTLRELLAPAGKLISYEYFYTDVGVYEKSQKLFNTDIALPFTTDKTLYTYDGRIGAGVDLTRVTFQVDHDQGTILLGLPQPVILSHEMGKQFEFYDVKKAVFGPSDFNDYENFRASLMEKQEEKLLANEEFWRSVRDNTERILRDLLTASGQVEDYTVTFRW